MVVTFKNCFTCWFESVLSENVLNVEFLADVEASVTSDTYNIWINEDCVVSANVIIVLHWWLYFREKFKNDYGELKDRLQTLPDKVSYDVMVCIAV